MKQATTAAKLFDQIVADTPPELKKQLDDFSKNNGMEREKIDGKQHKPRIHRNK